MIHGNELEQQLRSGRKAYVFFQDKLGGEISVIGTAQSPEISFDVTLAELVVQDGEFRVVRYGALELQTMDFHGSYAHAVKYLRDALRLHRDGFPEALSQNLQWASEKIEGPNIANVFKRTFLGRPEIIRGNGDVDMIKKRVEVKRHPSTTPTSAFVIWMHTTRTRFRISARIRARLVEFWPGFSVSPRGGGNLNQVKH